MYAVALVSLVLDQLLIWGIMRGSVILSQSPRWFSPIQQPWSSLISLVIITALLTRKRSVGLAIALGGAISNLLTFIVHGHAIDYLKVGNVITNLADILIVVGLFLFAVELLFTKKRLP